MDSINFRQDLVSEDEGLKRGECCQAIDRVVPLNQTDTLIQATLQRQVADKRVPDRLDYKFLLCFQLHQKRGRKLWAICARSSRSVLLLQLRTKI